MSKFKVGDKIRCVNGDDLAAITEGLVYLVQSVREDRIGINNDNGIPLTFPAHDFEPVKTPKENQKKTMTNTQRRLYDLLVYNRCFDLAAGWLAGLKGEVPHGWEREYEELEQELDQEYQEYLRLKAKFDGK